MSALTESEYQDGVKEIADNIREAIKSGELEKGDVDDRLHEDIDGHGFVIYTAKAQCVVMHSKHADLLFEEGSIEAKDWNDLFTRGAYYAMCQDVRDELGDVDDIGEEEDEDADEVA
jgi:hypothetical protein